MITHDCKDNNNQIRINIQTGHIEVGCPYLPNGGFAVIGFKDLKDAFDKAGFEIIKKEADK